VKEKELTRARDALAAERRRMPRMTRRRFCCAPEGFTRRAGDDVTARIQEE
jgi:hypothetical protein